MASRTLEINVKGTGAVIRPAERAIISIEAASGHEATPQAASEAITAAAAKIRNMVNDHMLHDETGAIHPESAIAHWSMSKLETDQRFQGAYNRAGQAQQEKTYVRSEAENRLRGLD